MNPPGYVTNISGTMWSPGILKNGLTYYWRIDVRNTYTANAGWAVGTLFSFTTLSYPGQTGIYNSNSPANVATVAVSQLLIWNSAVTTTAYNVYLDTVNPPQVEQAVITDTVNLRYDPIGLLVNDTPYYWRIDTVNGFGTTPGTVWAFVTEQGVLEGVPPTIATGPMPGSGAHGSGDDDAVKLVERDDGDIVRCIFWEPGQFWI